ncbi:Sensor protein CreC [Thauera sp. GDN1]|uniref:sensor histidine kinase n=1 Tax=Thauera sp. GDN1 TaxID=2944810 RepID=UPI002478ECFC|nr:ATP-binding protein [Thauera sp. GDN1]WEN42080.1 Sensor protein CreC [Thauera sp. GDN1]
MITRAIGLRLGHWVSCVCRCCAALIAAAAIHPAIAGHPPASDSPRLLDLAVLEDPAGTLTPGAAAAHEGWRPSPKGLSAGYSDSVWWLRFAVAQAAPGHPHVVLRLKPHFVDELRLYRVTDGPDASWPVEVAGDSLPARARPLAGLAPAFLLDDGQMPVQHYLLRLQTTSAATLALALMDEHDYLHVLEREAWLTGVDLGLQAVLLLLLAVQWWATRSRLAGFVLLAVAAHFVWRNNVNGLMAATLWADWPWMADLGVKLGVYLSSAAVVAVVYALRDALGLPRALRALLVGFMLLSVAAMALALGGVFTAVVRLYLPLGLALYVFLLVVLARNRSLPPRRRRLALAGFGVYAAVAAATVASLVVPGISPARTAALMYISTLAYVGTLAGAHALLRRQQTEAEAELRADLRARMAELGAREQAAREQGDLLRMLAHELKTPLAVTRMATDALRTLLPATPPPVAQRLTRIDSAAVNMNALVEKCLLLERVEGFSRLQRQRCHLGELVSDVVADCRAPERVHTDIAPAQWPEVWVDCDPDLLRIAVANLLDNALKYAPPDTPVAVRTRAGDDMVHIEVHNEGPPVPAEDLARLFDRFWRARESEGIPGVGLGLYLVRMIMRLHGGDAMARSAAGEGTTVGVRLRG